MRVKRNSRTAYSDHQSTAWLGPGLHSSVSITGVYFYLDSENVEDAVIRLSLLASFFYLKLMKQCINSPFTSCTSMSSQCLLPPECLFHFFRFSLTPVYFFDCKLICKYQMVVFQKPMP